MPELERKLGSELPRSPASANPSKVVVACRFPFPNWKPEAEIGVGIDQVWIYRPDAKKMNVSEPS